MFTFTLHLHSFFSRVQVNSCEPKVSAKPTYTITGVPTYTIVKILSMIVFVSVSVWILKELFVLILFGVWKNFQAFFISKHIQIIKKSCALVQCFCWHWWPKTVLRSSVQCFVMCCNALVYDAIVVWYKEIILTLFEI